MEDPEKFEILFRNRISTVFTDILGTLGCTFYYGFCDSKTPIGTYKNAKGYLKHFFVDVYDSSEASIYLRKYKRKAGYTMVNPDKRNGKYVFVYVIKPD